MYTYCGIQNEHSTPQVTESIKISTHGLPQTTLDGMPMNQFSGNMNTNQDIFIKDVLFQ